MESPVEKKQRKTRKPTEGKRLSVVVSQADYDLFAAATVTEYRSVDQTLRMLVDRHLEALRMSKAA